MAAQGIVNQGRIIQNKIDVLDAKLALIDKEFFKQAIIDIGQAPADRTIPIEQWQYDYDRLRQYKSNRNMWSPELLEIYGRIDEIRQKVVELLKQKVVEANVQVAGEEARPAPVAPPYNHEYRPAAPFGGGRKSRRLRRKHKKTRKTRRNK